MRRTDLLPGAVVRLPGSAYLESRLMLVRDIDVPDTSLTCNLVDLEGHVLQRDGAPRDHLRHVICVDIREVTLKTPSAGPLCSASDCLSPSTMLRRSDGALHPQCEAHPDLQGPMLKASTFEHRPTRENWSGQLILTCPCGWKCWIGANDDDPHTDQQGQVASAAHAKCGWSVKALPRLNGVACQGTLPITRNPCWFWFNPSVGQPQMLLWELRYPHLSSQLVRADGFSPSLPAALHEWPVELTAEKSADADHTEEARRARAAAATYIGDKTGLIPARVSSGKHHALPGLGAELEELLDGVHLSLGEARSAFDASVLNSVSALRNLPVAATRLLGHVGALLEATEKIALALAEHANSSTHESCGLFDDRNLGEILYEADSPEHDPESELSTVAELFRQARSQAAVALNSTSAGRGIAEHIGHRPPDEVT